MASMRRSTDRILVSHAGTLPRPDDLTTLVDTGAFAREAVEQRLPGAIRDIVRQQAELGVDIVNDGEFSKQGGLGGFSRYIRERITGVQERGSAAEQDPSLRDVTARDRRTFPGTFAHGTGWYQTPQATLGNAAYHSVCTGPLQYVGHASLERDIRNLTAAVAGRDVEPYLPAITPGTVEHWLWNDYYANDEALLFAVADVLNVEYRAIAEAGIVLQLDDPDLPDGWQMDPSWSVADYRKYAELRVEALNHALKGVPEELVRLHICWGSGHGPHLNDIPLQSIVDLVLKVHAGCYAVEAANPRHEYEWRVWQTTKLPEGKLLMPGVVAHVTDNVEHPQTVADRLIRFAQIVGRENVIAGTDCGLGGRVGHPEIVWAKLASLVEGARLASRELWS
jgi:5-methyltetrahydropteroyltriglutamate--homocysteine methyltransferase